MVFVEILESYCNLKKIIEKKEVEEFQENKYYNGLNEKCFFFLNFIYLNIYMYRFRYVYES